MNLLYFIGLCVVAILLIVIVILRVCLKNKLNKLTEKLNQLSPYSEKSDDEDVKKRFSQQNKNAVIDIETDLKTVFYGLIISTRQERDFTNNYLQYYQDAHSLVKKLKFFMITPSDVVLKLIKDFESIKIYVKQHNEEVKTYILEKHKDFFDTCLKYPLDKQQRRSIISEEENCLVVSSAGSGKTSSIIGKVKYLTEIKKISPQRILLISYTNKAATELTERLDTKGLKGYTFHKLAIDIIGKETGVKPSICDNTDALFVSIYYNLLENVAFKKAIIEYFVDYQEPELDWERRKNEKLEQLSEQKKIKLKAMFPDMDGKPVYVRSAQEQKICFVLTSLGVKFRYEEPYEHLLADEMHSQYRPDFSIYYEYGGKTKRIYLEHFGVDEHGLVPAWFAKDKNISYEEACQKYNDGITWKKAAHDKFGTKLIVTSSADFHYSDIKGTLNKLLKEAGVPIKEIPDEELYDLVLPKGSKQEKAFIRLIVTFASLIKSSCLSIKEVLKQVNKANDERSEFIIKKIFQPVFECYINELNSRNQIDFSDAILQATEICRKKHPVDFDYIIVDEFQDISIDRYKFLDALRDGNTYAKLYCVGDDWQSIYRFSGSDMALFNQFPNYFGATEINKIETTYRFGEPLVSLSSRFIQRNNAQIQKDIHSFSSAIKTDLEFCKYDRYSYCNIIEHIISLIPLDKTIFLLGRYSFDDYYLSYMYQSVKEGNRFYYIIGNRKIEFLTVHKSKGLEADYVILLQCNKDTYGFPSLISDDPVLNYVLTQSDQYPFGEERRLFYVAITRAKIKTFVLYDQRIPSVFVDEFLHPERVSMKSYLKHPNANKRWTRNEDYLLIKMYSEGKSIKYIADKMGRSQTSIVMRLNKQNKM